MAHPENNIPEENGIPEGGDVTIEARAVGENDTTIRPYEYEEKDPRISEPQEEIALESGANTNPHFDALKTETAGYERPDLTETTDPEAIAVGREKIRDKVGSIDLKTGESRNETSKTEFDHCIEGGTLNMDLVNEVIRNYIAAQPAEAPYSLQIAVREDPLHLKGVGAIGFYTPLCKEDQLAEHIHGRINGIDSPRTRVYRASFQKMVDRALKNAGCPDRYRKVVSSQLYDAYKNNLYLVRETAPVVKLRGVKLTTKNLYEKYQAAKALKAEDRMYQELGALFDEITDEGKEKYSNQKNRTHGEIPDIPKATLPEAHFFTEKKRDAAIRTLALLNELGFKIVDIAEKQDESDKEEQKRRLVQLIHTTVLSQKETRKFIATGEKIFADLQRKHGLVKPERLDLLNSFNNLTLYELFDFAADVNIDPEERNPITVILHTVIQKLKLKYSEHMASQREEADKMEESVEHCMYLREGGEVSRDGERRPMKFPISVYTSKDGERSVYKDFMHQDKLEFKFRAFVDETTGEHLLVRVVTMTNIQKEEASQLMKQAREGEIATPETMLDGVRGTFELPPGVSINHPSTQKMIIKLLTQIAEGMGAENMLYSGPRTTNGEIDFSAPIEDIMDGFATKKELRKKESTIKENETPEERELRNKMWTIEFDTAGRKEKKANSEGKVGTSKSFYKITLVGRSGEGHVAFEKQVQEIETRFAATSPSTHAGHVRFKGRQTTDIWKRMFDMNQVMFWYTEAISKSEERALLIEQATKVAREKARFMESENVLRSLEKHHKALAKTLEATLNDSKASDGDKAKALQTIIAHDALDIRVNEEIKVIVLRAKLPLSPNDEKAVEKLTRDHETLMRAISEYDKAIAEVKEDIEQTQLIYEKGLGNTNAGAQVDQHNAAIGKLLRKRSRN